MTLNKYYDVIQFFFSISSIQELDNFTVILLYLLS